MKKSTRIITSVIMLLMIFIQAGCTSKSTTSEPSDIDFAEQMKEASTTPYGKYPELVTYTLGKLTGSNNSNMPEGDTYEDNAYTRFLRDFLNIQNKDVFEEADEQYDSSVSMAIQSGNIPDIMIVSDIDDVNMLVEYDMIEDLTQAYNNCMSERIKEIYAGYGDSINDLITFDGKIMAIPETNIDDGPNLIWLRKDWMDKLGLAAPKNLSDVEYIIKQFIEKDPGENGPGNTVGLVCDPSLCGECGYSSEYLLDIVFAAYGAFPKQWIEDKDGKAVYGSIQPEAKNALAHINEMYETGILDNNFLLRTSSNIIELVVKGRCGSFFGPWWAPNNPLMEAVSTDPEADWQPYLIETDDDGSTSYHSHQPSYKYVVVRKGYEHPEVACKIVSVLFDYVRYEEKDNDNFKKYYQNNVDPTARPLAINVDYSDALSICYSEIIDVLNGTKDESELPILEKSYYESCKSYLDDPDNATAEQWAAYMSRIKACEIISNASLREVPSLFFSETSTMQSDWWKLEELENKTYLRIVTGELPVDEFDNFVSKWNENGGSLITREVRDALAE